MGTFQEDPAAAGMSERLLGHESQNEANTGQVLVDAEAAGTTGGVKQENRFRDAWAGALFLGHLVTIFYLGFGWGIHFLNYEDPEAANDGAQSDNVIHFSGVLYLSLTSSLAAILLAATALSVMVRFAEQLVQFSLFFSVVCSILSIFFFAVHGYWMAVSITSVCLLFTVCYVYFVWHRIPFAVSNLKTSLSAINANGGIFMVAYGMTACQVLFSVVWILAWLGVYVRSATCEHGSCISHMDSSVVVLFLLSYYWASEVGKNLLHVTVSGVVGTWWFAPDDATTFFSPAITDSFVRASTFSLGSICLGSLLTAVLQVLYHLADQARRSGRGNSILLCVVECIVGFLERMVAYFNKWAYVYIGLFGYDYLTAGKKVMNLFMERGWTVIIQDDLAMRVLRLMGLVIGLMTGATGLLLASAFPSWVEEFGSASTVVAFWLPFVVGSAIALILLSVVGSAVDTVIVSFAEAPRQFEQNHPGLHQQMVLAWRQVYPDEFTML